MINYSSERDVPAKQEEGNSTSNNGKLTKASSSSRQWSGLKDPRVVRVSRAFGGKDRHSKVCTIRGLRDRRVRLSVPTAIQLYDLQDRLGLNQPSKVVDWLLNAAKDEVDELPPLPATFIGQFPQSIVVSHEVMNGQQSSFASLVGINNMSFEKHQGLQSSPSPSNKGGLSINENALLKENQATAPKSAYWNLNAPSASNCKEVARETITERSSWMKKNHVQREDQEAVEVRKASNSSIPSLLDNVVPYNSYYQYWDPASLSLSHLGSYGSHSIQPDQDPHNYNVVPVPSPLVSLPPPASQQLLCPSVPPPSFFPPNCLANHAAESNTKQINHIPMMISSSSQNFLANSLAPSLYSISQPVRPFQLNLNPKAFHSQSNNTSQ